MASVTPPAPTTSVPSTTSSEWTELYHVFVNKSYPETWTEAYRERAHYALGLFLAQYLCNGFNLADAAFLEYNKFYFEKERKAFRFHRRKTAARSKDGSEVIIPIIAPLQVILDDIAGPVKKGARVFPQILEGISDEDYRGIDERIHQENKNIRKRIQRICKELLHWEVEPSNTWCRHSFATNLTHAGVEMQYVSESMGHSTNKTITERYIASFPISKHMKYNSKLLNLEDEEKEERKKLLEGLSKEDLLALVKEMIDKE